MRFDHTNTLPDHVADGRRHPCTPSPSARFRRLLLIAALCSAGVSGALAASGVNGLLPAAPSGLTVVGSGPGQIQLVWIDNSDNETAFEIERSQDGNTFELIAFAPANATGFVDSQIAPGAVCRYRLRATNTAGRSAYVASSGSPLRPPPPPRGDPLFDVTRPDGGEVWQVGSMQTITWTSESEAEFVSLRITYDDSVFFYKFVSSTENDGSYDWEVAGPVTSRARICVGPADRRFVGGCSDELFRISNPEFGGKLKVSRRLNLGYVPVGRLRKKRLTLRNTSRTETLQVRVVIQSNPDDDPYRPFFPVPYLVTIPPRGKYTVWVYFIPYRLGRHRGTAFIDSSDAQNPVTSVRLRGLGIRSPRGILR